MTKIELNLIINSLSELKTLIGNINYSEYDIPIEFSKKYVNIFSEKYSSKISDVIPELEVENLELKIHFHSKNPVLFLEGDNHEQPVTFDSIAFVFIFNKLPITNNRIVINFPMKYPEKVTIRKMEIFAKGSSNNNLLFKSEKINMGLDNLLSRTDTCCIFDGLENFNNEKYYFSSILETIIGESFLNKKKDYHKNLDFLINNYLVNNDYN